MKNIPQTIFLQVDPAGERPEDFNQIGEATWCKDRINSNDLEYVIKPKGQINIKAVRLFGFNSLQDWVKDSNRMLDKYRKPGAAFESSRIIYLDAEGFACTTGEDFRQAEANGTFPVTAYRLSKSPIQ
jgi:hypothetical protein